MQENIAEEEINENEPSSPSKVKIRGAVVANRAAMFESSPSKHTNKDPALMSVAERKALFEKNKGITLFITHRHYVHVVFIPFSNYQNSKSIRKIYNFCNDFV